MAKSDSYLGIDIGGSSLKIVELANVNNRPQLVTYGFIDDIPNIIKDDNSQIRAEIASHLKHLVKETKVTSNRAVAALPSFSVFSSIINLPAMKEKDLISAVRWEAKKFVPIPLEEMILDWEVLQDSGAPLDKDDKNTKDKDKKKDNKKPEDKNLKGNLKVLLTAAPNNLVNRYVDIFKQAGLSLVGLETESFALERALV
ncbi:MAG: pilus assembly protein PilM, partial [bacterium]|nr:pilus assembly protein PilM [bacterium]